MFFLYMPFIYWVNLVILKLLLLNVLYFAVSATYQNKGI
jgi:hypothetical protein